MAELLTLSLFVLSLAICLVGHFSILAALVFGLFCFGGYALYQGHSLAQVGRMLWEGAFKVKLILLIFVFIGLLTAAWRASGTISYIIVQGVELIAPRYFVLCTFLLCSVVSFLTGTSFGTAGTVGVICMMLSDALGLDPLLSGGAILSGIFFGDRASPMSSSAQLVCVLTGTDIYANIRAMMRSALLPFLVSCFLYTILAAPANGTMAAGELTAVFQSAFSLHWLSALPAVLILVLALCHVPVLIAMAASVIAAIFLALTLEGVGLGQLAHWLLTGYASADPALAALLNGGGLSAMLSVSAIVLISSSYSGIFLHTPLLSGLQTQIKRLARPCTPFGAAVITAFCASAISCNQTLATTLTHQLCGDLFPTPQARMLALEDTVIVIAALIPWSIAGAVPIAAIGATGGCLFYAFYLYLIPLWNWALALAQRHKCERHAKEA